MTPLEYVKHHRLLLILVMLISVVSSILCFYSFLILHIEDDHETVHQHYYIIAGCLAFVPPIIMCVTLIFIIFVIKEGNVKDLHQYLKIPFSIFSLKFHVKFLISFSRVIVLFLALFQILQISNKSSSAGFYAVLGSLVGSFCLAEYMNLLEILQVIDVGIEKDFGYFKFIIASAFCAVQNLYGFGKYMVIVMVTSMFLYLMHGLILTSSHERVRQNQIAAANDDDENHHVDGLNPPSAAAILQVQV